MGLTETWIFYVVIGVGVAGAVYVRLEGGGCFFRLFQVLSAWLFWPLMLPVLLARPSASGTEVPRARPDALDSIGRTMAQVEAELDAALSSLDGWAEDVLARENDRIAELCVAWNAQADRIRDLDRLLAQPESSEAEPWKALGESPSETGDRWRQSEQARRRNLDRLRQVRSQAYHDLMGTLAWVRELVSMIHLAKFTGAPASRAEELVTQIAAAVEGVSAVTWQDRTSTKEPEPWESSGASATLSRPT